MSFIIQALQKNSKDFLKKEIVAKIISQAANEELSVEQVASRWQSKVANVDVDMIDINERALNLARSNASINKVDVNIFESDIYSNVDKKYDYIITNPPIRVGKKILYEILIKAKEHLKEKGHLIFVINKDQGAKSTMKDMEEYYSVKLIEKNKGFYVIDCQNY